MSETVISYGELFDETERDICRSVARKFENVRKLEREDAEQEAALAILVARSNPKAKVKRGSKDYGKYIRTAAQNALISMLRATNTEASRVAYDPKANLEADRVKFDSKNLADTINALEEFDRTSFTVSPDTYFEIEQVLEKIMIRLLRHSNGIQLVALFQDLLANQGIGKQSNRATNLREEQLQSKGKTAPRKHIPNETLFEAHRVSYRQGQELVEIVADFLTENGYAAHVNYAKRNRCRKEEQKSTSLAPVIGRKTSSSSSASTGY